jgi:hypothetical protein
MAKCWVRTGMTTAGYSEPLGPAATVQSVEASLPQLIVAIQHLGEPQLRRIRRQTIQDDRPHDSFGKAAQNKPDILL